MFKLKQKALVWWPVTINEPIDGGQIEQHNCQFQFELIPQKEFDQLAQTGDIALLQRIVAGWKDLLNEQAEPLAFNKQHRDALFELPYVRAGLLKAYMAAATGALEKNS